MKPINCDLHDYLEIACVYKIQVHLTLTNGECYNGVPVATRVNAQREECLQFLLDSGNEPIDIPFYMLEKMNAIAPSIHFSTVTFTESNC